MTFTYYNIKQVFVNDDGIIVEKMIKRTMNEKEAVDFLILSKELKPRDKFYMYTNIED